jgi:phage shock protein PspC (stress-responsive transcriptional regulator)
MKACRSNTDRMIAGVYGGLAENLGWSVFRMRMAWVMANLFTAFAGVPVHLALWYLMPKAPPAFASAVLQPWKRSA